MSSTKGANICIIIISTRGASGITYVSKVIIVMLKQVNVLLVKCS